MALKFRVDDFPLTKPEEGWRHNLEAFKRFNDVMVAEEQDYARALESAEGR